MKPIEFVESLLRPGEELLYLTYFGSLLYGTSGPNSDKDYKGIFLPSKEDLLLMNGRKSINWKSGTDEDKNSSDDVDVELWSIHYFINLIGMGDTGAIDLLFSPSNPHTLIYKDSRIDPIFDNPLDLFDPRNTTSFIYYAINQAKKYGVKGSRLGILKRVYEYLERDVVDDETFLDERLHVIAPDILENLYDSSYCFHKVINGEDALVICGKTHLYSIKIGEFYRRISREYTKYGERAKKAENNEGVDWKAISHALRCIYQLKELLITGKVEFPLKDAPFLIEVKNGEVDWKICEEYITSGLEEVKSLQETTHIRGEKLVDFIDNTILNMYNE